MFEWFFIISLFLGGWLIYEMLKDKIHGPGRYWITMNVEGDAERIEYLIKKLAKDNKIKIRSYRVSTEKPTTKNPKRIFSLKKKKENEGPK